MKSASTSIKTLDAVIDLAINMEKHSLDHYKKLCDATSDPKCRKLFTWLVEQEDEHCQTYLRLREDYSGVNSSPEELVGGYGHFIEILVKEVTETLNSSETLSIEEEIEKALYFEESVIKYFQKVKSLFPEDHAEVLQQICDEEQEHIDAILNYQTEIGDPKNTNIPITPR